MNSSRRRLDLQCEKYPHISSNGLCFTKRTSKGLTLAWPENATDIVTFTDSNVSCMDIETELDAQVTWFIVQMRRMDDENVEWSTVYRGYGQRCEVDGLDPDSLILFRMKRNGEMKWGTEIIVTTVPPQATAKDLNRAVEMSSQYLVTRILGNTPHGLLKKILSAHDKNGMTPLMVTCHHGNPTIAKMLLSCGSHVNVASTGVGRTALMIACITGKMNLVQLLDQHECDWRPKDKSSCNSMHHAINGGNFAIVRFAFARLGNPKVAFEPDHCGWTPLMRAVIRSDSLGIIKLLVGKGANRNDADRTDNKSILMAAILSRKLNFFKFLLEWGADPFYKNSNGKNSLDLARGLAYKEIATTVRLHMEEVNPDLSKTSNMPKSSKSKPAKQEDVNSFSIDTINNNNPWKSNKLRSSNSTSSIPSSTTATDKLDNDKSKVIFPNDSLENTLISTNASKVVQRRRVEAPSNSISILLETHF